jgi:hypothetical protein
VTRSALIVIAATLLLSGASVASAKNRGAVHAKPAASINETLPRSTVADPYYRLSNAYYGDSDLYHGLFDLYALPPMNPGYSYGHVRPIGR